MNQKETNNRQIVAYRLERARETLQSADHFVQAVAEYLATI